jgi:ankyrin repeat protein
MKYISLTIIRDNKLKTARILLEHGADINVITEDGWSLLETARTKEAQELLKEYGAEFDFEYD